MKKYEKMTVINNQEDEDFEGYTLYAENAIEDTEPKKRMKKNNPDSNITEPVIDNSHKFLNTSRLTIVRNDD